MVDYQFMAPREQSRTSGSKYDFVKVKVWLGENRSHHYVLSRFLISRMLTVTKIPYIKAVKISLDLKKQLVDHNRFDISQAEFEENLFRIMRARGFGDEYVQRYKMVTNFFQQRRPLIIFICGVPCTGKSTVAQQLASRLNLPNVLQTDIIYELLRSGDGPLNQTPLWERADLAPQHLVPEFLRECNVVRRGLEGDLNKCIRDGKSIILEGLHLEPGLYFQAFRPPGPVPQPGPVPPPFPSSDAQAAGPGMPIEGQRSPSEGPVPCGSAEACLPSASSQRSKSWSEACSKGAVPMGTGDASEPVGRRAASFILSSQSSNHRMQPRLVAYAGFDGLDSLPPCSRGPATQTTDCPMTNPEGPADLVSARRSCRPVREPPEDQVMCLDRLSLSGGEPVTRWEDSGPAVSQGSDLGNGQPGERGQWHANVQSGAKRAADPDELSGAGTVGITDRGSLGTGRGFAISSRWHMSKWRARLPTLSEGARGASPTRGPSPGCTPQAVSQGPLAGPEGTSGLGEASSLLDIAERGNGFSHPAEMAQRFLRAGDAESGGQGFDPSPMKAVPGTIFSGTQAQEAQQRSLERTDSGRDGKGAAGGGPVLVPIVLRLPPEDHELLVEEWYARLRKAGSGWQSQGRTHEVLERMRILESRLAAYEAVGIPVVTLRLLDAQDSVDQLHDYLLQCLQMAMEASPDPA